MNEGSGWHGVQTLQRAGRIDVIRTRNGLQPLPGTSGPVPVVSVVPLGAMVCLLHTLPIVAHRRKRLDMPLGLAEHQGTDRSGLAAIVGQEGGHMGDG
jgi:hypothetical protein